jgi:nucleoside-diphosphate-sugar epimerase
MNKKKILITGGCGYVGSLLSNTLAQKDYKITIIDTLWFGNNLIKNKNIKIIKADIRNIHKIKINGFYAVIHLANISMESAEVDPNISWDINVMASLQLVEKAKASGVKKFIYASSGSVYGIKKERKVTEELSLVPLSIYNKTKMIFEKILMPFNSNDFKVYSIRPGTICGISPRIRWDLSVNALTLNALKDNLIKVFGGKQFRPHIHIKDMVRVYEFFLNKNIKPGIYNAAFECLTITKLAQNIQKKIQAKLVYLKSNDIRSYRLNSEKLIKVGFTPKYFIKDAINEIMDLHSKKLLKEEINNYNLKKMKKLNMLLSK